MVRSLRGWLTPADSRSRAASLEARAKHLEIRAQRAEEEAALRERIVKAQGRIKAVRPGWGLGGLSSTKVLVGLLALVIVVLLVVRAC